MVFKKMGRWIGAGMGIVVLLVSGYWIYKNIINLPGIAIPDQGRDHWEKEKLEKFVYNSVPSTSGPHDVDWIRPGVYATPQDKYKLIHSLEHGYIEIHYKCDDCKDILADFVKKIGLPRIIVQLNPDIDKPIVIVAWARMLKMNSWDEQAADKFARAFHNKGPEQTME